MGERVIIDFETTGLSAMMGDRATEVAAVVIDETGIIDRFQSLMNGGRRIPPFVQQSDRHQQRDDPPGAEGREVMRQLLDFIAGRPLVAHNAAFDHGFLGAELDRIGEACPTGLLCSMKVARRVYPEAPNHRLETLIRHVRIEATGQYHRALADAEMTALLWLRMEQQAAERLRPARGAAGTHAAHPDRPLQGRRQVRGQLQASGLAGLKGGYAHELNLSGLRFWPLARYPHLVFYVERPQHIEVWRVLHGQRDIPAWMQQPETI
jgi:DNA polymerase-3 subunit epsilon